MMVDLMDYSQVDSMAGLRDNLQADKMVASMADQMAAWTDLSSAAPMVGSTEYSQVEMSVEMMADSLAGMMAA